MLFLAASIFSFLSWREANLARQEQRGFFVEEKSPFIDLTSIRFAHMDATSTTLVQISIKNNGLSSAREITITVTPSDIEKAALTIDPFFGEDSVESLEKGREKDLIPALVREERGASIWDLDNARLYSKENIGRNEYIIAHISLKYNGIYNDKHSHSYYIAAKKRRPPK